MGMTIFILLFSAGMLAILAALLHTKKIPPIIFGSIVGLLFVFDFAVLSLDKIYALHYEQDQSLLEKVATYEASFSAQADLYQKLTELQMNIALEVLTDQPEQFSEREAKQALVWRDDLLQQMQTLGFPESKSQDVARKINAAVHTYLMEQLNQELIRTLGHRTYGEFVRTRPRQEWTDELFLNDLQVFLTTEKIDKPNLVFALERVNEFDHSGMLMEKADAPAAMSK